ncbi:UNVERIFIED_CONTAM: hypothetical protein H355_014372 [Colinus virginianus]|nr:hypothetical protein H355_014372 [Colinus virginianus]
MGISQFEKQALGTKTLNPQSFSIDRFYPMKLAAPLPVSHYKNALAKSCPPVVVVLLLVAVGTWRDSRAGEEGAIRSVDHAVVGGVVAVVVFAMLCLLIILGRYFARHKGTYFTHEAKGADDAADADTAIINAEGGQNNSEEKKEYFI